MSNGSEILLDIIKGIFPNQKIILEHNIADSGSLFLDIYLPQLDLALEYDGAQHFSYSQHFHSSLDAFRSSKKRDELKTLKCKELGIVLIRVRFDEVLTKDLILDKLEKALNE